MSACWTVGSHHQIEQANGLDERKAQNGVGEELAAQARVPRHSHQQRREHHADTNAGTAEADGSRAHTEVLRDLDERVGHLGRVGALGLGGDTRSGESGGGEQRRGALHGVEGGGI